MVLKNKASKILIVDNEFPQQSASAFFSTELVKETATSKSHSRGLTAFAVGVNQAAIGVDLEDFSRLGISKRKTGQYFRKALNRSQLEKIVSKHFPSHLEDKLNSLSDEQFIAQFFTYWVSLEALLKATRQGLVNLDLISPALCAIVQNDKKVKWQGETFYLSLFKPFEKTVLALVQSEKNPVHFYYEDCR